MQRRPFEMANDPLRNVDKLVNKELCHRRADSFINKVHTTVIMQTVAVSSTKLTRLHAAAAMLRIHHCWTNVRLCQSSSPLCFRFSQMFSKFTLWSSSFLFNWSAALMGNAAACLTPMSANWKMDTVTSGHGSFRLFTNCNLGKNNLGLINSTRGKELLKLKLYRRGPPQQPSLVGQAHPSMETQHTHQEVLLQPLVAQGPWTQPPNLLPVL